MVQFVKVNIDDIVYDRDQKVEGKVKFINNSTNTAKIEVIVSQNKENGERTTKLVESKLFNLLVIEQDKRKKSDKKPLKIKVKYFNDDLQKIEKITQGDWIDLRASNTVELKAGEFQLIPLGVAMQLPKGFEAYVVPRSSTFKNFGVIQTNHHAVIDESYQGDNDQWFYPVYALRDTTINLNERICQFRIQRKMPEVEFETVQVLGNNDRGGLGSTGTK